MASWSERENMSKCLILKSQKDDWSPLKRLVESKSFSCVNGPNKVHKKWDIVWMDQTKYTRKDLT
jgi:hypothetical protein